MTGGEGGSLKVGQADEAGKAHGPRGEGFTMGEGLMLKLAFERGQPYLLGGQNPLEVSLQAERFISVQR